MIIYYAHHLSIYNTVQETKELKVISRAFKDSILINPNGWIYDGPESNSSAIMEQCYIFVKQSDMVIFSALDDGVIGRGVYCELETAFENNKKVYFLFRNALIEFYKVDFSKIVLINNGENWKRYAKVKII